MIKSAIARYITFLTLLSIMTLPAKPSTLKKGKSLSDAMNEYEKQNHSKGRLLSTHNREVNRIKIEETMHPLGKRRKQKRKHKNRRVKTAHHNSGFESGHHESKLERILRYEKLADPEFDDLFPGRKGIDREYMKLIDGRKNLKKKLNKKQAQLYEYYRDFEDKKKGMKAKRDAKLRKILQQASVDNFFDQAPEAAENETMNATQGLDLSDGGLEVVDPKEELEKKRLMGMHDLSDLKNLNIDRELERRHRIVKKENKETLGIREVKKTSKASFISPRKALYEDMPKSLRLPKKTPKKSKIGVSPSFLVRNKRLRNSKSPNHFFKGERHLFESTGKRLKNFFGSRNKKSKKFQGYGHRKSKRKVKKIGSFTLNLRRARHQHKRRLSLKARKSKSKKENPTENNTNNKKNKSPKTLIIDAIPEEISDLKNHSKLPPTSTDLEPSERKLIDFNAAEQSKKSGLNQKPKSRMSHKSLESIGDSPPPRQLRRFVAYKLRYKKRKQRWRMEWEEKNGIRLPRMSHMSKHKKRKILKLRGKFKREFKFDWVRMKWISRPKYKFKLVESVQDLDFWRSMGFYLKKKKLKLEDRFNVNPPKMENQMQCVLTAKFGKFMRYIFFIYMMKKLDSL